MKMFDPSLTAMLNDRVNDLLVEWSPDTEAAYRKFATELEPGVISFDGRMFDGWRPVVIDPDGRLAVLRPRSGDAGRAATRARARRWSA